MTVVINGTTGIDTGTGSLISADSTTATYLDMFEDTDNGSNYVRLIAPASIASNKTITLPDETGTVITSGGSGVVSQSMLATAVIPIGVGQTWQNFTASRSSGTTYTNSTGRPIFVSIQLNCSASGLAYAYVNLNGTDIGYLGQGSGASPNTLYSSFCTIVVPNGVTYKATITGSASFGFWFELR